MDEAPVPAISAEFPALAGALETVASGIELFAILILLNGLARFVAAYVAAELRLGGATPGDRLNAGRVDLSRYILSALEVFIVSDIVRTVLSPTLDSLAVLGALVVIRSTISFFLEREIRDIEQTRSRP